jgi:hypothetical protein
VKEAGTNVALIDDLKERISQLEHLDEKPRGNREDGSVQEVDEKRGPDLNGLG